MSEQEKKLSFITIMWDRFSVHRNRWMGHLYLLKEGDIILSLNRRWRQGDPKRKTVSTRMVGSHIEVHICNHITDKECEEALFIVKEIVANLELDFVLRERTDRELEYVIFEPNACKAAAYRRHSIDRYVHTTVNRGDWYRQRMEEKEGTPLLRSYRGRVDRFLRLLDIREELEE